jgi:hypothetical protein
LRLGAIPCSMYPPSSRLYLDESVRRVREDGYEVAEADLARVSPLMREHVRVLGRYHFILDESVVQGGLRPLQDPIEPDEYEFPLI